jgi:hypothetical protein
VLRADNAGTPSATRVVVVVADAEMPNGPSTVFERDAGVSGAVGVAPPMSRGIGTRGSSPGIGCAGNAPAPGSVVPVPGFCTDVERDAGPSLGTAVRCGLSLDGEASGSPATVVERDAGVPGVVGVDPPPISRGIGTRGSRPGIVCAGNPPAFVPVAPAAGCWTVVERDAGPSFPTLVRCVLCVAGDVSGRRAAVVERDAGVPGAGVDVEGIFGSKSTRCPGIGMPGCDALSCEMLAPPRLDARLVVDVCARPDDGD